MTSRKKMNSSDLTFENALEKLEKITDKLSKGELSLDKSVKLFEEAMHLRHFCLQKLNRAEEKIKKLVSDNDNEFKEEDFKIE